MTLQDWEKKYNVLATAETEKGYRSVAIVAGGPAYQDLHNLEDFKHHVTITTNDTSIVWVVRKATSGPFRVVRHKIWYDISTADACQSTTETRFYRSWSEVEKHFGNVIERVKMRSYGSNEVIGDFGQGFPVRPPADGSTKFFYYNDPNGDRVLYVVAPIDPYEWH